MKLSYIIVALAALAVANAGSVDLKVEGEKITITPKATPITAPLVKETVCHRILQTSIQTCIQEDDPTTCLLPGYGSGGCPAAGFPTCCHLATISTQWFQDPKCPIALEPCPKNVKLVKKVAESGLGKCFSPCSSNSDCQDPQCDSCVLSPAGGNVCGIAPKVKNVAAPIMELVKKNAKFQKLLAVWDDIEKATDGGCPVPGHCGRVYQGCCFAAKGKEFECKCKLTAGDGAVGDACEGRTKAGACGDAYAACCAAYKKKGFPCTCDIALPGQWGSGYRL